MTTWQEQVPGIVPPNGRTAAWAAANPRSGSLAQRARRTLPGGVTHDVRRAAPFPLAVARAEGAHKWDLDGHEIICYVMGHGALLLGHSDPAVVAAVRHQATLAFHPGACHELECEWAEMVVDLVPSAELVRFTASGTEASLLALRLARAATGRPRAVADALADGDVAAVILEPSGAAWGTVPLPAGLLTAVRELTAATGTVLVFDEVVSGFRWSPGGVQAAAGVTPDLTVLGKILAGGMPGGAVAGRAELMEHLALPWDDERRVAHPGTHNAHPVSAAAGIAALRQCRSGQPQEHAAGLAAALRSGLTSALAEAGVPGRAYGESSTFHLLFGDAGEPEQAGMQSLKAAGMSPELSAELHTGMLLEGVHLFHGSGFLSAAHTERDVERTVAALAATLARLPAALLP